jgi:predicted GIY-YIG superfamily endonuclease
MTIVTETLYIYRDTRGATLYIGVTSRNTERADAHHRTAVWWDLVATAEFQHFSSRKEVLEAERAAIKRLRPYFNTMHNGSYRFTREQYDAALALAPDGWAWRPTETSGVPDVSLIGTAVGQLARIPATGVEESTLKGLRKLLTNAPTRLRMSKNVCQQGMVTEEEILIVLRDEVATGSACMLLFNHGRNGGVTNATLEIGARLAPGSQSKLVRIVV